MDKKHHIDAPNDESLRAIEQVDDRSELSTLYFKARDEWSGKEMLTDEQREAKRTNEVQQISMSIRRRFATVGILVPTPLISLGLLLAWAATYLSADNFQIMAIPAILAVGVWLAVSFFSIRKVRAVFENHALRAAPFVLILFTLLGLAGQAIFLSTNQFQPDSLLIYIAIISGLLYLASIILSGILLLIWTSPRLSSQTKISYILLLATLMIAGVFTSTVI